MLVLGTNNKEIICVGDTIEIHEVDGLPEFHIGPDIVIGMNRRARRVAITAPRHIEVVRKAKVANVR